MSSRRASRSSYSGSDQSELVLECKAAYLSLYDEIKDEIQSREDLVQALQQTGRNPKSSAMKKYWTSKTDSLTFDDFVDICRKEPITTEDDLMKAFRKIDINGDGYLSLDELYKIMSTKGEKMSREEVKKMIDEVDENRDGRLDYGEFCKMVISTANECKKYSMKIMEKKEKKRKKDQQNYVETSLRKGSSAKMGSQQSLQSQSKEETSEKKTGSMLSIRSDSTLKKDDSKESDGGSEHSDVDTDEEKKGKHKRKHKNEKSEDMGSKTVLKSDKNENLGSRASLKSASKLSSRRQSQTSQIDQSASRTSLRAEDNKEAKTSARSEGISGSRTSLVSAGMSSSRRSMLSIDDLPRPSPRSKKDRPRGGAAAKLDRLPEPRNLKSWTHKSIKGCFFLEDEGVVCHHYDLSLEDDSKIWITIQPVSNRSMVSEDTVVDTALYIVKKNSKDEGSYVAFTELRDSKGKYGKECNLSAGEYSIYPMTTGCHLKSRTREPKREVDIVKKDKDDKVVITKPFKKALEDIFEVCDLDGNGLISKEEFGWFNKRTSDEIVTDEEWEVVEDRIELEDGEITKQGFLHLHQMEAEDAEEGDPEDLWLTLTNFGFNKELVMDEACPFKVDVYAEECDDVELKVSDLECISEKLAPVIIQSAIDKGDCTKIKGMKDLFMYTYINDGRATVVVDNKSYSRVKLDVDCSSSKNCLSNTGSLHNSVAVNRNSQEIGLHLVPADESYDWTVRCSESILK